MARGRHVDREDHVSRGDARGNVTVADAALKKSKGVKK